jgi:hypothetical protein
VEQWREAFLFPGKIMIGAKRGIRKPGGGKNTPFNEIGI